MKKITKDNKIFLSNEFQKDKYKFDIILKNLDSKTLELYSDEKNYIICREEIKKTTWIWTKDNFDYAILTEIESSIKLFLTDNPKDKFTCKKELYDLLKNNNFEYLNDDYFEMGFLMCHKTKNPKECDGYLDIATINDKETLARYWYAAHLEMNGVEPITLEDSRQTTEELINTTTIYIWKNKDNIITSMGYYSVQNNQARISGVYTYPEERGKGYAANLIYKMTNIILEKGHVPLLYTDYNYIPSNKAYINVGYESFGILINFTCSKNRNVK